MRQSWQISKRAAHLRLEIARVPVALVVGVERGRLLRDEIDLGHAETDGHGESRQAARGARKRGDGDAQSGMRCTLILAALASWRLSSPSASQPSRTREHLREAAGVALLGLRERLEPLGDVVEALVARGLRHAGVHRLVLVRLAGDGRLEVLLGVADGQARRRVADLLEVVEVTVRVAGLAVGRLLEVARDLGVALDVGDLREIEVAPVRLRLAGERLLEVLVRLGSLKRLGHLMVLLGSAVTAP